ncbi:hypothetical protein NPIL_148741 [Nephila pilipes]|uniref:Uncharacterized protein n=1 Tax=Nephila pilipes TaxID=299642 RepID=A0A8X6PWZ2_NEPPI|nr:hypothetical protein NPIL_148741 [Nephila pilipes]
MILDGMLMCNGSPLMYSTIFMFVDFLDSSQYSSNPKGMHLTKRKSHSFLTTFRKFGGVLILAQKLLESRQSFNFSKEEFEESPISPRKTA